MTYIAIPPTDGDRTDILPLCNIEPNVYKYKFEGIIIRIRDGEP